MIKNTFNQRVVIDGGWTPLYVEQDCSRLKIDCPGENYCFHWADNSNGSGFKISNNIDITITLKKGDIAGYIKAPEGFTISILGMK